MTACQSNSIVKTRKPHECLTCCEIFPKGTIMDVATHVDSDGWSTTYLCKPCVEYIAEHDLRDGDGVIWQGDVAEHRYEYGNEL